MQSGQNDDNLDDCENDRYVTVSFSADDHVNEGISQRKLVKYSELIGYLGDDQQWYRRND